MLPTTCVVIAVNAKITMAASYLFEAAHGGTSRNIDEHDSDIPSKGDALTLKERLLNAARVSIDELKKNGCALPELLPDNNIRVICSYDQRETWPRREHDAGAFLRVFAILVLIDQSHCITSFIRHGVNDSMLPISLAKDEHMKTPFGYCFDGWDSDQIMAFDERQWTVLPPLLERPTGTLKFPQLDARYILPFTKYSLHTSSPIHGGFSEVFKVRFHTCHSLAQTNNLNFPAAFALKRISPSTRGSRDFSKEIEALGKFSGQETDHPHIIKLLAAFSHDDKHYLVFPWADSSLRSLWRENPAPNVDRQSVSWLVDQLVGITGALGAIHQYSSKDGSFLSGRHGDIKPENILVFNETSGAVRLCIADFGVARFHTSEARLNRDLPTALTPTYRPPEFDLRSSASQKYDIWSLGCVCLEMITWLLQGYDGVKSFAASRMASRTDPDSESMEHDAFFALGRSSHLHETSASIEPSVERCIDQLQQAPQCSVFFHDLLDLIKNEMLQVDEKDRATSFRVLDRLKEMQQKCRKEADYTTPKPFPLKPPWTLRDPYHIQTHPQTQKFSEIKDFDQIDKKLTVSNTAIGVNMAHVPNHYQPGHAGDTSGQPTQYLLGPAKIYSTPPFLSREQKNSMLPAGSNLVSSDAIAHHNAATLSKNSTSEKGKRKLNVAVCDFGEERLQKRAHVEEGKQQQADDFSSLFIAEHQQIATPRVTNQQVEKLNRPEGQLTQSLFACPFHKRQPQKFVPGTKEWSACAAKCWTIPRLKEHIYRTHCRLPYQCSRCFEAYGKQDELTEHQRATRQCLTLQQPEYDGINESQKCEIKKRNLGKTDEDKWRKIYRIIFKIKPTDETPNPYWEKKEIGEPRMSHSLSDFREYLDALSVAGDSGTQGEAQICMRLLQTFEKSNPSSQSTKNLSLPTLEYGSSVLDTNSQEIQDQKLSGDIPEAVPTGLEKPDFQVDDFSMFDFTSDFFQNGTFRWGTNGNQW